VGCAIATFTAVVPTVAFAGLPEQAQAMSERAAAYIATVGEAKALAGFTRRDSGFVDGDLFVFCYDRLGVVVAHGENAFLVGRNLLHLKDTDGREPIAMGVKAGFGTERGWIDFKWPNAATKKIERKSAYMIRTNDVVCGVGYYRE
jgi:cytochrome c